MLITPIDSLRYKALAYSGLLIGCVLIALYLASYLFLIKLSSPLLPPIAATPMTVVRYWQHYGTDPYTRHWLIGCLVAGAVPTAAGVLCLIRPINRSLHGDARFATLREVANAGLLMSEVSSLDDGDGAIWSSAGSWRRSLSHRRVREREPVLSSPMRCPGAGA